MEAIWFSETSVDFQRTTRCYISNDSTIHNLPLWELQILYSEILRADGANNVGLVRMSVSKVSEVTILRGPLCY
jgi:hypothetical protein